MNIRRSFWHRGGGLASLLTLIVLLPFSLQQQSTVYPTQIHNEPYTVTSDLVGAPTLIYNCAKLPAICANVEKTYPRNPNPNAQGGGGLVNGPITMHYDLNKRRKNMRRRDAGCVAKKWRKAVTCPEAIGPPVALAPGYIDRAGRARGVAFRAQKWTPPPNVNLVGAAINAIADPQNQFKGLIWTCDEFPPAM